MGEKKTRKEDTWRHMNISEAKPSFEDKSISANALPYYKHGSCPTSDFPSAPDVGFTI